MSASADVFAVSAVTVARGSPYRVNSASKRRCDSLQALVGQDDRSSLADGVRNVAPEPPAYPYPHILPTNAGKSRGWPTRENFRLDSSDCRRKGLALGSLPPTYRKRAPSHPRFEGYRNLSACNWRRERDSNPRRAFDPYTLSRGAPSTTRPSLRALGNACVSVGCAGLSDGPAARGGHDTEALCGRQRGFGPRARAALRPQAASRARTNSCTDSSAASSASGLLPPACAKSARPPPRPPTCAATAPASSPALMRAV